MIANTHSDLIWNRVTAAKPCPVCGRPKWCSVSEDGDWAFCMHVESERASKSGQGWMHRLRPGNSDAPQVVRMHPAASRRPTKITSYEAIDAEGKLVAIHVREEYEDGEKDFKWYGPDRKIGIKRLGLSDRDVPLYRLPQLLEADPGRLVVLCEGEKAADALAALGVVAVGTMTGAAVVPSPAVLAPLVGRNVLLWPDNDEPGRKHMRGVAATLIQRGVRCHRLDWADAPPKGDAADFVRMGGTLDELHALYQEAVQRGENDALAVPEVDHPQAPMQMVNFDGQLPIEGPSGPVQIEVDHPWSSSNGLVIFPGALLMSEVRPRKVDWLWQSRLALGENTVLDGDPGLGKTMWLMDLCARITTGGDMPDGAPNPFDGEPRGVVILNCEDSPETSLAPRLEAAGADRSKVVLIQSVPTQDGEASFPELLRDLPWIEKAMKAVNAALVIVDPLVGFLGDAKEISANSDQDMRRVLNPFGALMRRMKTAGVTVRHLRKQSGGSALYRGSGSIAISATARGGLLVARDPYDRSKRRRILAVQKSNLAQEAPALVYRIVQNAAGYPHVEWLGASEITSEELLSEPTSSEELSKTDEAIDFLESKLADGPMVGAEVISDAKKNDVDPRTLRRARIQLGITRETGCVFKQGHDRWYWKLPEGHRARFYEENQRAAGRDGS